MALLLLLDRVGESGPIPNVLVLLLVAVTGLTFWECRTRGYRAKITLWWVTFVALTHVIGYLILRFFVSPPRQD